MKKIRWILLSMIFGSVFAGCSNKVKACDIYHKAMNAYLNRKFDDCLVLCKQAISYDSNMEKAMFLEAKAEYFLGKSEVSCELLKKLNGGNKGYTDASLYYVHGLLDLGKSKEANVILDELLEWNQNDYRLWYLKSIAARKSGNVKGQIEFLKKAELCLSDSAKVFSEMSIFYRSLDMAKTADAYETKAIAFSKGADILNE